jgi:hypothetical protein
MSHKLQTKKYSAIAILFLYLLQSPLPLWNRGGLVLCYAADDHFEIEYLLNNQCIKSSASLSNVDCCPSTGVNLSSTNVDRGTCVDIPLSVSAERYTGRNSTYEIKIPTATNLLLSRLPDANSLCKASLSTFTPFPQNKNLLSTTSVILLI